MIDDTQLSEWERLAGEERTHIRWREEDRVLCGRPYDSVARVVTPYSLDVADCVPCLRALPLWGVGNRP